MPVWHPASDDPFGDVETPGDPSTETYYAQQRSPDSTYLSRSFPFNRPNSSDAGQPARFVHKVFDNEEERTAEFEGSEWVIRERPGGRVQLKLLVVREAGNVKELWIQRVPAQGSNSQTILALNIRSPDIQKLIDLIKSLDYLPIEGEATTRVDDDLIHQVLHDPSSLQTAYRSHSRQFRNLISDDASATDVVALAYRRQQVALFERYLDDDAYFDQAAQELGRGPEAVWQTFLERNPWILGMNLGGQLFTGWNADRLEQVLTGHSITGPGKRVDALMKTAGIIRSCVFAEIKTHRTHLLGSSEYRPGCWSPSAELAGAVSQAQNTVQLASRAIGDKLVGKEDGVEIPGDVAYLYKPRSFLIIGRLTEITGASGGHHPDKVRSLELLRGNLHQPEIVTFDELLERAKWIVDTSLTEADLNDLV